MEASESSRVNETNGIIEITDSKRGASRHRTGHPILCVARFESQMLRIFSILPRLIGATTRHAATGPADIL